MVNYAGTKKKICVIISGKGTNLLSIIKKTRDKSFPAKVILVVTNNHLARGLFYAKLYKIPVKIIKHKNTFLFESSLLREIKKKNIDIICLAGFMKILSKNFIKKFRNKILNIHPSLLPKYKGLDTYKRAIRNKEKESGCTVHFVSEKIDSGKIILQSKVKILKNETEETLQKKILKKEHIIYAKAIRKICNS